MYTDTIAKLQAKDLWGTYFAQQRSSSIKAKKNWGQTGLRDLTHYNVARQNEHCKWVHSAVYSRVWNKRTPLNKRSPWKIWQTK